MSDEGRRTTYTQADTVECPACKRDFTIRDGFEVGEGGTWECPHCHALLVCTETDIVRWWRWAVEETAEVRR